MACGNCETMGCVRPVDPRQMIVKQLNEASFAMDDAALFLDTHPECQEALQYYQSVVSMRKSAVDAYMNQFGPLFSEDAGGTAWNWITERWPWEGGMD